MDATSAAGAMVGGRGQGWRAEELAGPVDQGAPLAIGEEPEVADADEAAREHVHQETPEEFVDIERHDLDFDQGLVVVRRGKGDNDRSTLLAEVGRDELRAHLRESEAQYQADRLAGLAGVWMPDALDRKYPNAGRCKLAFDAVSIPGRA